MAELSGAAFSTGAIPSMAPAALSFFIKKESGTKNTAQGQDSQNTARFDINTDVTGSAENQTSPDSGSRFKLVRVKHAVLVAEGLTEGLVEYNHTEELVFVRTNWVKVLTGLGFQLSGYGHMVLGITVVVYPASQGAYQVSDISIRAIFNVFGEGTKALYGGGSIFAGGVGYLVLGTRLIYEGFAGD